jgi:hypothetical protein
MKPLENLDFAPQKNNSRAILGHLDRPRILTCHKPLQFQCFGVPRLGLEPKTR